MTTSLVSDRVVTTSGADFTVSDRSGDINPGSLEGFYSADTRFLSEFRLRVGGKPPSLLGSSPINHRLASFYLSTDATHSGTRKGISVVRDRYVDQGLHEDISIFNHSAREKRVVVSMTFNADFADLFQVRRQTVVKAGEISVKKHSRDELRFVYRREKFKRETRIHFSETPRIDGKRVSFSVILAPRGSWKVCVSITPVVDEAPPPMQCVADFLGAPFTTESPSADRELPRGWANSISVDPAAPAIDTARPNLRKVYDAAVADLASLTLNYEDGRVYAAGLPWFIAIFGRDSIFSAIQTKILGPDYMIGTLRTLARYQSDVTDAFREATPGKIAHEIRRGELSVFEEVPHSRYYGSVDATPLFLILAGEMYKWTGRADILSDLEPNISSALNWIDQFGDADGDGFVEYPTGSPNGLRNQGWKDSEDSISFAGGRLASGPIALAEVQGYVYAAKLAGAEIYSVLGHDEKAAQLAAQAAQLKGRFEQAFWMPEHGFYAIALDGKKRQVDSITSNIGHCLWSGIVGEDRARAVIERLMAPDMFSGWGVRTLSTQMARYDPVSYHNGSVWPHDNSIVAAGFRRYGFHHLAESLLAALFEAAAAFPGSSLPELFAGYPRRGRTFPVPYPGANAPQAWAAGAIVYGIELILRIRPDGERLVADTLPMSSPLAIYGVEYRGRRWDF